MRILIVGAGAVGGYFGARLAQAGREVTFLVRPTRAERLRTGGLAVTSPLGDVTIRPAVITKDELTEPFDVVLVTVKAYGLAAALDDLGPAVGPGTVIIPTLNGMAHIEELDRRYGSERVFGGVCVIAAQLDPDGTIRHLGMDPALRFGELDGTMSQRVQQLRTLFTVPGFDVTVSETILTDLWEKWVFLSSAAATTCLLDGTIGQIEAADGTEVVQAIIDEATSVAAAAGQPPRPASDQRNRSVLTTAGSTFTASMYRDRRDELPIEREQIIGDLVARGRAAGLALPLLTTTNVALTVYEQRRAG